MGGHKLGLVARANDEGTAWRISHVDISMRQPAVEIDRISRFKPYGRIKFGVQLQSALDDISKLLACVAEHVAEFFDRADLAFAENRNEALVEQIRRNEPVSIRIGFDNSALAFANNAATSRAWRGSRGCRTFFGKENSYIDTQPLTKPGELVVTHRHLVVLDFR